MIGFTRASVVMGALALAALATAVTTGCGSASKTSGTEKTAAPAWITKSNELANEYSHAQAKIFPESGSGLGYREYDKLATRLDDELEQRAKDFLRAWLTKLDERLKVETDPQVKIDVRVLRDSVAQEIESYELSEKYGEIPFEKVSESVFYILRDVINEQSPAERKKDAVDRFHKYVRGFDEDGKKSRPKTEASRRHTERKLKLYTKKSGPSKGKTYPPLRAEVEKYLKDTGKIVDGIGDLLAQSGRDDWKDDYKAFKIQMRTYDNWVRTSLLPLTRRDFKLPHDMYALSLKRMGNTSTPEETREIARKEFAENIKIYQTLAADIAKRDGLKESTPKAVLAHLKENIETNPDKIRERYVEADRQLSADIQKRDLATLPTTPLRIRVASEAESRLQPVPSLNTPVLIGNTGERPEFVVPVASRDKLAFDDFAFPAAAKSLTAHEGRPGHDLQFSTMLDNGVSLIRASYAHNSVNVEGWGLYAEWLMEPSLSQDEKMALMMMRVMRNARMFLDPELHLGLITPAAAKKVITDEVAMTPEWADLELQRYMFKMPGQAPSYYYGYLKLRAIRDETMKRMGSKFRERCFHDAILNAGMLPLGILAEQLRELRCD